jgi:Gas vesicle synthesis protein GvpL/GvpF
MTDTGVWVYAIADHAGGDVFLPAGVAGTGVRAMPAARLTVLASYVDLADFGETALRRNLENLEWLEEAARAHHDVVDAAARVFPVLPARFATVYSGVASMVAALGERGDQLRAALARVGGCMEWGVKAYALPEQRGARSTRAPAGDTAGPIAGAGAGAGAGARPGAAAEAGAGMAYLNRRRAQISAQRESSRTAAASAREVHVELSGHAAQARLYPPQAPSLSGTKAPMLLNAAYLIDAGGAAGFSAVVASAAAAHPDLRLDLTGPWPPYSFAGQEE